MSVTSSKLGPSGHVDDFSRRNLPPSEQWPELLLDRPEFQYPEYLNAGVELTDRMVEKGFGDHTALIGNGRLRTYKELADWSNRLAHALVENYGVKPGNRVLIRSGNNPALVAAWLAATKAGAVVVNTMPLLRAGELNKIVDKDTMKVINNRSPTTWFTGKLYVKEYPMSPWRRPPAQNIYCSQSGRSKPYSAFKKLILARSAASPELCSSAM